MNGVSSACSDYQLPGADFRYYDSFLCPQLADFYYETFIELPFAQGEVARGKERRESCFYSALRDGVGLAPYTYAGKVNYPLEFTDELLELGKIAGQICGCEFNSCLVNLYRTGKNVIGWHSDSEVNLKLGAPIASISLGAERLFDVRRRGNTELVASERLLHGSMIVMGGSMQTYYQHQIRAEAGIKTPRINLTYRVATRT